MRTEREYNNWYKAEAAKKWKELQSLVADSDYRLVEGSYSGTSDDCAGRYYLIHKDADLIDKRGPGINPSNPDNLDRYIQFMHDREFYNSLG